MTLRFGLQMHSRVVVTAVVLLVVVGLQFDRAEGRYQAVIKMPPAYVDKIQQKQFHRRAIKEYTSLDKHPSRRVRGWYAHLQSIQKKHDEFKLNALYRVAHSLVRYRSERKDVWSTAGETIARGYGDCDDYAHIYITAASLVGFDMSSTWLVVGHAHIPGKPPIGHAVAVIETHKGQQFVLDNLNGRVMPESEHKTFKPFYSINIEDQRAYLQVNTMFEVSF